MKISCYIGILLVCVMAVGVSYAGESSRGSQESPRCTDSVTIDSVTYAVPPPWCGHALDSSEWAVPSDLTRLPERFCHKDYRIYMDSAAASAFVRMGDSALADSVRFTVQSGYRSPGYQRKIIMNRMKAGKTFAEVSHYVAPPGYSEHHTGRAADLVCGSSEKSSFAASNCYPWLKANAGRYGFYESYPRSSADSIPWEPWQWTYHPDSIKGGNAR